MARKRIITGQTVQKLDTFILFIVNYVILCHAISIA